MNFVIGLIIMLAFFQSYEVSTVKIEDAAGAKCNATMSGETVIVNDVDGNERALICLKTHGKYNWRVLDNYPTLGEFFNPAEHCLDIVQRRRGAKTGLYWIKGLKKNLQVWCDITTDGGGFMLVGSLNGPAMWKVPSNASVVTPHGPPHWSSEFGNFPMIEFRIQVSTTNDPKDLKVDWLYHFTNPRRFSELLVSENGSGCKRQYPGVGHIEFIKDLLLSGKVVTRKFQCSRFGPAYPSGLGWQMMNNCLKSPCKLGFAVLPVINLQYDKYGGFSFNTNYPRSGIQDNSTAFVGCDDGKCCVCFGPKGGNGDYCSPGCRSINGGKALKNAHVWFWIRSFIPPSPVWKKCSEFQMRTKGGNIETHFINPTTGIVEKGTCSKYGLPKLIDGIVDAENKETLESIPQVQGLLSYRNDNKKMYVANGNGWEALGTEVAERNLSRQLSKEKAELLSELNKFRNEIQGLKNDIHLLKSQAYFKGQSCSDIKEQTTFASSGVYWIKPDNSSVSPYFQVYCDMETHGGGWTLVYSYTFTNYNNFGSVSNAVTPRPNWPAPSANVPISTTPPVSESSRGAVNYSLWKYIGNDVMIKSNINDWIVCQPNGGSLVTKKNGGMRCQNIKHIAPKCHNPPWRIYWGNSGPTFNTYYYFFDGATTDWCPTHAFCGGCNGHKKGISNPGGTIYIR